MGLHRILVLVCPITHVHTRVLGIKGTGVEKVIGLGLVWQMGQFSWATVLAVKMEGKGSFRN